MDLIYYIVFLNIRKYKSKIWSSNMDRYFSACLTVALFIPYVAFGLLVLVALNMKFFHISDSIVHPIYIVLFSLWMVLSLIRYISEKRIEKVFNQFSHNQKYESGIAGFFLILFFIVGLGLIIGLSIVNDIINPV